MTQPTAPRSRNPAGIASLSAGVLLVLMSATGQLLSPLVPFLAAQMGVPYETIPLLVSIPAALLAVAATASGVVGLLLRNRSRTAAIIGTTLGAAHLILGIVGVIGTQIAQRLY